MSRIKRFFILVAATGMIAAHSSRVMAQDTNANDDRMEVTQPEGLDDLKGIDITSGDIKKYFSTERPEDLSKQVVIYNVGAKKFLNIGNYWGTHATLSDVPHIFWLQRHSDDKYTHSEYIRYPEAASNGLSSNNKSIITSLLELTSMKIGSMEGSGRSHSAYTMAKIVGSDGSESPITFTDQATGQSVTCSADEPYTPNGNKFTSGDIAIDFANQQLALEMDLTGVTTSASLENMLTIGQDISNWNGGSNTKLHFYAKMDGKNYILRIQFIDNGRYAEATNKYEFYSSTPIIKVTLDANGLYVNGERLYYTGQPINAPLAQAEALTVANTYGGGSGATHTDLRLVAPKQASATDMLAGDITLTETGTTTKATDGKFAPDGALFLTESDVNFGSQKLIVDIDMSTATHSTDNNENTLSIGGDIKTWKSTTAPNMHLYFNGWPRFNDQGKYDSSVDYQKDKGYRFHIDFTSQNGQYKDYTDQASKDAGSNSEIFIPTENLITISTADGDKKVVRVELSEEGGLCIGGKKIENSTTKAYVEALLALTHIQVGSASETRGIEGNKCHSTFYGIRTENLSTVLSDKTLSTTTTDEGFTSEPFALSDYTFTTTIDVATCQKAGETALSIGKSPSEWYTAAPGHENLHMLFHGKMADGSYVLQVSYAATGYSDDVNTRYIASADGKFNVAYSKNGLYINGTPVFLADNVSLVDAATYTSGKEGDIVLYTADDCGHLLIDTDGKYTINEESGTGIKTSQNNYLYTEDQNGTFPVFITMRNIKETTSGGKEGKFLAWTSSKDNTRSYGNIGVFTDRGLPEDQSNPELSLGLAQWTFAPVTNCTASTGNIYTMSITVKHEILMEQKDADAPKGFDILTKPAGTKLYLAANQDYVYSNNLKDEHNGRYYDDSSEARIADINSCEGMELGDEAQTSDFAHWKVFSLAEYYKLFESQASEMTKMVDMTFWLKDPDFKREQSDLKHWFIDDNLANGKTHIGYDECYKVTTDQAEYIGSTDELHSVAFGKANNHARYMGVEVKSQGAKGRIYQDVEITYAGWYAITCQGMSNAGAKLFVQMIGNNGESLPITTPLTFVNKAERERLSATSYTADGLPGWPYDWLESEKTGKAGMPFYNALVDINDRNVNDGVNVEKYSAQVSFYVDSKLMTEYGVQKIRFGVMLDGDNTLATANDETVATTDEWTVFDNFHLLFGGNSEEPYLILNEDSTTLNYITSTIHHYTLRPMTLHRTIAQGQCNTIILPVSLTMSQFYATFGEGAQLAEAERMYETENKAKPGSGEMVTCVNFKKVTASNADDVMLKANTPYIIINPENIDGGDTEEYVAHLYTRASGGKDYITVTSPARHFFVDDVTLEGRKFDDYGQYYYEFPTDYTFTGSYSDQGVTSYGTICQNYTTDADGNNTIIEGRPTLKGCYMLTKNALVKVEDEQAIKGFRCWFDINSEEKKIYITIDDDVPTSITDIVADTNTAVNSRYAKGVYNLLGQKVSDNGNTDSLCPGIYIVNGKKVVITKK